MRFNLILHITSGGNATPVGHDRRHSIQNRVLPINYQYPLHSWIYKVIQSADAAFSRFLHDEGYRTGHKSFKLFTFSPLSCQPYKIYPQEQRIALLGEEVKLQISFLIHQAAEHFVQGLFAGQQFSLGDPISQVDFEVVRIEAQPLPDFKETMHYRCLSPVVISQHEAGQAHAQYLYPEESQYADLFLRHLVQKQAALPQAIAVDTDASWGEKDRASPRGASAEVDTAAVDTARWAAHRWQFRLLNKPRKKGIHIKQHTPEHTQVVGYLYDFALTAPPMIHKMAYYAGFGEKNSLGFGMGKEIKG